MNEVELYRQRAQSAFDRKEFSTAVAALKPALALAPHWVDGWVAYGEGLAQMGAIAEATSAFSKALELDPSRGDAAGSRLYFSPYDDGLSPEMVFRWHLEWAEKYCPASRARFAFDQTRWDPDKKLKIGMISNDFRHHSLSFFIQAPLSQGNGDQVEYFAYSDVAQPDDMTEQLKVQFDHWRDCAALSEDQIADLIYKDQIDLLIDLAGHSRSHRLKIFAMRPSPCAVTWLGYAATTGIRQLDGRIVDEVTDPLGQAEGLNAEPLIRLNPAPFLCFTAREDSPPVSDLPALTQGFVTFCSFNNPAKLSPRAIALYCQILEQVPHSRLILKGRPFADIGIKERYFSMFSAHRIGPERIEILPAAPDYLDHMRLYHFADLALDSLPYTGTTTTMEALWMGLPVVTLAGTAHWQRVGASLLKAADLSRFVAQTDQEFVDLAVYWANQPKKLQQLRTAMRGRLIGSPLMDAPAFARKFEKACREIWQNKCQLLGCNAH